MDSEFVRNIHEPQSLQLQRLQDEARSAVEDRLAKYRMRTIPDPVREKLTYTYYHDWKTDDPKYVFLLADPGIPGEHVIFEVNAYVEANVDTDLHEAIQVDRRFGSRWLVKDLYVDLTDEFVTLCEDHGLISTGQPWWQYVLSGEFFGDFYMTDVVKYRNANPSTADINASFTECLVHELEYVQPELIFAFGKRAWETLQERLVAKPVDGSLQSTNISNLHGTLHETDRLVETAVLPLGHPSPNFRGAQLSHEEYMKGVARGIRQWKDRQ